MKIFSLRAAIEAAFPDFKTDPDRLGMWTEKGGVSATLTPGRGLEFDYVANITLENFVGHPSVLFAAINDWLRDNQRELLQPGAKKAYQFETIVMDDDTIDLHLQVNLTELVSVAGNGDGTDALQHLDDSLFALPDNESFGTLKTVIGSGGQILPGPPLP